MKYILCILLLTVFRCMIIGYAVPQHDVPQHCEASSLGTNFMLGLIGYYIRVSSTNVRLHITPVMQEAAHVRVTAPYIKMDRTFTVSNYTLIPLNGTLLQYDSGKQFKGIEVSSDVNISLAVVTGSGDLVEGFLALPVTTLSTRYTAASYIPYSVYSSEVLIAGVESDTDVVLSTVIDGHRNPTRTFRLQKFETYQFKANNDVSGSVVTSNKPVAVFSGSAIAQVPVGIGDIQYIVEQMIPTKYWTTQFIVPSVYPRKHFVLKLFADQDNSEIQYYNNTNQFTVYMNAHSMVELTFGTDPVVVVSNKPISVIQYGHDGDNMAGDPFMTNTQGISQFQASYKFVTQNHHTVGSSTLAITILKNSTDGLILNGQSISYWNAKNVSVYPPMDQYTTLFVNVSHSSYYHLHHSGGKKFGAVIYGRPGTIDAYGYPLQLSFTDIDCKRQEVSSIPISTTTYSNITTISKPTYSNITTIPTPMYSNITTIPAPMYSKITTVSTPTYSNITTASTPTYSNITNHGGKVKWCLHCDGMTHLQLCDRVQRCQTEDEVCYVQSYTRSLDVTLYRSGCINPQQCTRDDGNGGCLQCCNGSFCNIEGCGDKGFRPLGQRGPLCFDCTHIFDREECNTVQLCDYNQVCMIEKYKWGQDNFHNIMGCTHSQSSSTSNNSRYFRQNMSHNKCQTPPSGQCTALTTAIT